MIALIPPLLLLFGWKAGGDVAPETHVGHACGEVVETLSASGAVETTLAACGVVSDALGVAAAHSVTLSACGAVAIPISATLSIEVGDET